MLFALASLRARSNGAPAVTSEARVTCPSLFLASEPPPPSPFLASLFLASRSVLVGASACSGLCDTCRCVTCRCRRPCREAGQRYEGSLGETSEGSLETRVETGEGRVWERGEGRAGERGSMAGCPSLSSTCPSPCSTCPSSCSTSSCRARWRETRGETTRRVGETTRGS